ncbi:hypothetical protein [uncultured Roseobacter sp.]|uniref:hypothetical protein n=1 Tax=uncultured Roseobacter sp. TaxID=114847 RepID=UPI00262FADE2|nr:hypothetical protein [uncultured Roseobacter sp.]
MTASIRNVASSCLDKTGRLSLREDILGVYANDNPQNRSVLAQMNRIQTVPFVKIALVTIQGASPQIQRDLDNANAVWVGNCNVWVYPTDSITVNAPALVALAQDDCNGSGHSVSSEEDQLFDLGRNLGANIVAYYIQSGSGAGCAAHPPGRRGFWADDGASPWTFIHELTHVVGDNPHIDSNDSCNLGNLMTTCGTANINVALPNLTNNQCDRINGDADIESC